MTIAKAIDAAGKTCSAPLCSIAYLVSQYPKLSESFILREVVQLRKLGFQIDVASINSPDRAQEELTAEESIEAERTYYVKEHGLTGAAKAHFQTLITDFIGYLRGLRMVLQLGELDLRRLIFGFAYFTEGLMIGIWMKRRMHPHLHVHLGAQSATVGLYVRRTFGFGLSITVHGPDEFYDTQGQYLKQKIAAADFICCISSFARSQLMKCSPYVHWNKLVVSRLGVDSNLFSPVPFKEAPEVFEILCVGRLTPAKGQHLLIEVVERLAKLRLPVKLRLVGTGTDEGSLRRLAAQIDDPRSVIFEGPVDQNHIRTLYANADLFCIPSFAEGIPVVLMEAMAMGIPCVTTRVAGIPELIRDEIDGLLVAPSDVDGLVQALAKLMGDVDLRKRIARNGRARVIEQYDLRQNVEKLATIFEERIKTSRVADNAVHSEEGTRVGCVCLGHPSDSV
jgi:glycosyltransferase involved in cell wall biosynthesis